MVIRNNFSRERLERGSFLHSIDEPFDKNLGNLPVYGKTTQI